MKKTGVIDSPAIIAERLRQALAATHMKQSELADSTGFSRVYVNQIVKGRKEFYNSDTHLRKIAIALKINPGWLIRGTGTMESAAYGEDTEPKQVNLDDMHIIPICRVLPASDDSGPEYIILESDENIILPKSVCGEDIEPFALKVESDMLTPALKQDDFAIIKKEPTPSIDGVLYAIWFMNRVYFRFITISLNGCYTLSTSPTGVRAEPLDEEQSNSLITLGRVIARLGPVR